MYNLLQYNNVIINNNLKVALYSRVGDRSDDWNNAYHLMKMKVEELYNANVYRA